MGMFDSFYFAKGVLPDNKVDEAHEFQCKSLGCSLDVYRIAENGTVTKTLFFEPDYDDKPIIDDEPINDTAYVYSYVFKDIDGNSLEQSLEQEYKIVILNSKVMHVEKIREEGYTSD